MRFVVFGAGAVGGVVAGRLAQGGHDVEAIARGAHGDAMRRDGLRIETPDGTDVVPLTVVSSAYEIDFSDRDAVLLAVKSQDTAGALEALRAVAPTSMPIVCLQNAVANEPAALRLFANVYGICVMCPTGHLEPGVVQAYSVPISGILDIGRYPSGIDATADAVAAALSSSSFVSEARPDIMRWKYRKLMMNLGNAIEALCGPEARQGGLMGVVHAEGEACLRAAGIDVASDEEERARRGEIMRIRPIAGQRRGGGSTWQSLERRTGSIETDFLNGEIVLLGRQHGVATPANTLLQDLTAEAARAGTPPGTMSADDLLARL